MEEVRKALFLWALVRDSDAGDVGGQEMETAKAFGNWIGGDIEKVGDGRAKGEVLEVPTEAKAGT